MRTDLTNSAIRVYSTLNALSQERSIFHALLPFLQTVLAEFSGQQFDRVRFATRVSAEYKWNFHPDIADEFVPLFIEADWLSKVDRRTGEAIYDVVLESSYSEAQAPAARKFSELASKFREFSENLSPLTALVYDTPQYERFLVEWLLYIEAYSEESLNITVSSKVDERGKLTMQSHIPKTTSLTSDQEFLCARFVRDVLSSGDRDGTAKLLSQITAIGLLTEVVQDFRKPASIGKKLNLTVYIDGPIALELVGASGVAAKNLTRPVIESLQAEGAQIRVFSDTLEEMKRVLNGVLKSDVPHGPTADAMRRGEVRRDYVEKLRLDPELILSEFGVATTSRTLDQFPNEHQYFSNDDYDRLYSDLSFHREIHPREHDAKVATYTIRARGRHVSYDPFDAKVIFVTRNGVFAQKVRRLYLAHTGVGPRAVPPVIHRRSLTTALWLRNGLFGSELEVPKQYALAACERVLSLDPRIIEAAKRNIGSVRPETSEQLSILIDQPRSAQALLDKTLAVPETITVSNAAELFEAIVAPYTEEVKEKAKEDLRRERQARKALEMKYEEMLSAGTSREKELDSQLRALEVNESARIAGIIRDINRRLRRERTVSILAAVLVAALLAYAVDYTSNHAYRVPGIAFATVGWLFTLFSIRVWPRWPTESRARKMMSARAEELGYVDGVLKAEVIWENGLLKIK